MVEDVPGDWPSLIGQDADNAGGRDPAPDELTRHVPLGVRARRVGIVRVIAQDNQHLHLVGDAPLVELGRVIQPDWRLPLEGGGAPLHTVIPAGAGITIFPNLGERLERVRPVTQIHDARLAPHAPDLALRLSGQIIAAGQSQYAVDIVRTLVGLQPHPDGPRTRFA